MKNSFLTNLKLKDWALIVVSVIALFFFINFSMSSSGYKKDIKKLEKESREIQKERDLLSKQNEKLKKESISYINNISKYQYKIDSISDLIYKKDVEIKNLTLNVDKQKKEVEKTKKKIDNIEKNPIKKTGIDLIESIKEKTK